jgi:hypothetical protein
MAPGPGMMKRVGYLSFEERKENVVAFFILFFEKKVVWLLYLTPRPFFHNIMCVFALILIPSYR